MGKKLALQKILDIRHEEKNKALLEHKRSVDQFEQVATQLYETLKAKEEAERQLKQMYDQAEWMYNIRHQTLYIERLKDRIHQLQREVQLARGAMEKKQVLLTEKHVEMKKVEKMIEYRHERERLALAKEEMKEMDEISLHQFMRAR